MIINKEGKIFGKISIIDIAVVLIIIVLAACIYIKFWGTTQTIATTAQDIECTFV
ncbi:MAG: DUF4330 family protein, partial [Clostridia bacterium]|nr:DUF4330 family protein [Clostridia bacterium]